MSVCLFVAYIGPKSRKERPRKTKIGTKLAHMTRTPLSRSKGQRSRSLGLFTHRRVDASGGCGGGRENVLAVGTAATLLSARNKTLRRPRGRRGAGAYRDGRTPTTCL